MTDMWICFIAYSSSAVLSGIGIFTSKPGKWQKFFFMLFAFWFVMAIAMGMGIYFEGE